MSTVTVTERWEVEELAECVRCGYPTTVAPVARGVVVAGGILCDDCRFHLIHIGEWGDFLARLTRPEDDGPDGDGGPAAPAARPTLWLIVNGQLVPRELSPAEEEELVEFSEACRASAPDVEPCVACNRPASPYMETPDGPLCWRCWTPDTAPAPGTGTGTGTPARAPDTAPGTALGPRRELALV
jgi:hypothetical protein